VCDNVFCVSVRESEQRLEMSFPLKSSDEFEHSCQVPKKLKKDKFGQNQFQKRPNFQRKFAKIYYKNSGISENVVCIVEI
jgi:hypothetical protein